MKNFFLSIFKALGHRVVRPGPGHAAAKGPVSGEDVSFFHGWLKKIIWGGVKYETGGKKLNMLFTSDIDPNTGRVYDDYIARRQRREEKPVGHSLAATVDHDVFPHG